MINLTDGTTLQSQDTLLDLKGDSTETMQRDIVTDQLTQNVYACVLQARIKEQWVTLDTATFSVTATDASASEAGADTGRYTITRVGNSSQAITVNFSLTGTSTHGTDYSNIPLTISFAAGDATPKTVTITPIDDTLVEQDETVILTLVAGNGYFVGTDASATVTIADNDHAQSGLINVSATDSLAAEQATDPGEYTITRTGDTNEAISVQYTLTGTADNGTDYVNIPLSIDFAIGETSKTITLIPVDDSEVEGDESVILTLTSNNANSAVFGNNTSASITIRDNDSPAIPPQQIKKVPALSLFSLLSLMFGLFGIGAVSQRKS